MSAVRILTLVTIVGCATSDDQPARDTPRPEPRPSPDTTPPAHTDTPTDSSPPAPPTCGSLDRVYQYGSIGDEEPWAMAGTPDGGFVLVGEFWGSITFGAGEANETTLVASSYSDTFVTKYTSTGTIEWVQHVSGPGTVRGTRAGVSANGAIAVLGIQDSDARVAPGTEQELSLPYRGEGSDGDIFLVVLEPNGTGAWATTLGGDGMDEPGGVAIGDDGAVYATGYYEYPGIEIGPVGSGVTLANDSVADGEENAFLARFRSDGTLEWTRVLAGAGAERPAGLTWTADGNVVVAGQFTNEITFSYGTEDEATSAPAFSSEYVAGNFIASYTTGGALRWWRTPSSLTGSDDIEAVVTTGALSAIAGVSGPAAVFGEGEATAFVFPPDFYTYVSAFDEDGNLQWVRLVQRKDAYSSSALFGLHFGEDGSTAVAGYLNGLYTFAGPIDTVEGDAGLNTLDPFVATWDPAGNFQCAWVMQSNTKFVMEQARAVWLDGQGGVWVAGYFSEELRIAAGTPEETTLSSPGDGTDIFLARFLLPSAAEE